MVFCFIQPLSTDPIILWCSVFTVSIHGSRYSMVFCFIQPVSTDPIILWCSVLYSHYPRIPHFYGALFFRLRVAKAARGLGSEWPTPFQVRRDAPHTTCTRKVKGDASLSSGSTIYLFCQ